MVAGLMRKNTSPLVWLPSVFLLLALSCTGDVGTTCFQDDECNGSLKCCHEGSAFTQGSCQVECDSGAGGTGGAGGVAGEGGAGGQAGAGGQGGAGGLAGAGGQGGMGGLAGAGGQGGMGGLAGAGGQGGTGGV